MTVAYPKVHEVNAAAEGASLTTLRGAKCLAALLVTMIRG
ncbi:hypothetical protein Pd630_LPD13036 (plasmid) [Rhodococcus opacus PD630]|nr:hypothetical protein Pd630_LPD13036 [Rhodococcus opacus PD630]